MLALPQQGQVVGGQASISQAAPGRLDVTQGSDRAVIDWRSFSIGAGETTAFHQPSASSVAVNRVTGADPSAIEGSLTANGQVVLVNPNGILFDHGAHVNVGGLVASTSSISTENAMAGNYVFDRKSGSPTASIVNRGAITAAQGGLVALVAPGVRNDGIITANLGRVSLASGNTWTLDLYGDHLVSFAANDKVVNTVTSPDGKALAGVVDTGRIVSHGGRVELSANVAKGVVDNAINLSGVVEANSVTQDGGATILGGIVDNVETAGLAQNSETATDTVLGNITAGTIMPTSAGVVGYIAALPAVLNVTVTGGQSKIYGEPDPVLAFNSSGYINSDSAAIILAGSLTRTPGENVGNYSVTQGSLHSTSVSYTINFTGNTFSITPAQIIVSVSSGSVSYDSGGYSYTSIIGVNTPPGAYGITGISNNNYTISYTPGAFMLTPSFSTMSGSSTGNRLYAFNSTNVTSVAPASPVVSQSQTSSAMIRPGSINLAQIVNNQVTQIVVPKAGIASYFIQDLPVRWASSLVRKLYVSMGNAVVGAAPLYCIRFDNQETECVTAR